jgi:hypothetical protein
MSASEKLELPLRVELRPSMINPLAFSLEGR